MAFKFIFKQAFSKTSRRYLTSQYIEYPTKIRHDSYILFIPPIFAAGLGIWQLQRKEWKEELIKLRKSKIFSEPYDVFSTDRQVTEYDSVKASGKYLEHLSVFIGPRVKTISGLLEKGYVLITPLKNISDNRVILVNRGWIPDQWRKDIELKNNKQNSIEQKEVNISGVVCPSENPSMFVPKNEPENGQWFWIDTSAIAKHNGFSPELVMLQEINKDKSNKKISKHPLERGGFITNKEVTFPIKKNIDDLLNFSVMPNDHVNYCFIWFSLCIAMTIMAFKAITKKKRIRKL